MMTKLQAVNRMLEVIGEKPVASLTSGLPDADNAIRILDRITEETLAAGWMVNTDRNLRMEPNVNDEIPLSTDALRIDTVGVSRFIHITVRDQLGTPFIYDIREKTFKFTKPIYVDVVWNMEFEDLTFELQTYIAARAARQYQESEIGSQSLAQFVIQAEREAWARLQDAEAEAEDSNVLLDNAYSYHTTRRYNILFGR